MFQIQIKFNLDIDHLGQIKDRAFLVVDDNEQLTNLYPSSQPITVNFEPKVFTKSGNSHTLDILVENMGRENFGGGLNSQRKWLSEDILVDNKVHTNWQMFPLDFKPDFIEKVRTDKWSPVQSYKTPTLFRARFDIKDEPRDTYLRLDGWHATFVFINGFNAGRYWNNGPQKALYIPVPHSSKREVMRLCCSRPMPQEVRSSLLIGQTSVKASHSIFELIFIQNVLIIF